MAIEKIALVNIVGLLDELNDTLLKCCESGCFHIETAVKSSSGGGNSSEGGLRLLSEKNPYGEALKKYSQISANFGIGLKETQGGEKSPEDYIRLAEEIERESAELSKRRQSCSQTVSELESAVLQINHLKGLDSDFKRIFSCSYVASRVGKLPADNLPKLDYYNENFFFVPFETGRDVCWGMYFCPASDKELVDDIFRSMYFERIHIPDYVTGTTEEALASLEENIKSNKTELEQCEAQLKELMKKREKDIQQGFTVLKRLYDIFDLRRKVGASKNKFYMKGFIPEKKSESFEKLFEDMKSVSVVFMPPDADASCTPPTILKNSWLTRPFGMMVEMYGLPSYNGFNPTSFVAITYTLLFGIMFGDLGQGLLVFLGGLLLGKKLGKAGGMVTRVGLSSMIFGTLYGSFFGYEELLDPVFESVGIDFLPLKIFKQTNFILLTAVGIGIVLILMSMLINIYIGFKEKNYEKAVFGCNGIAGLIFYGSVVTGVVGTMMLDMKIMSAPFVVFLIVIPALCIFCRVPFAAVLKYKEWRLSEDEEKMTFGNFIVENFFEMFEYVLSYVSNTMSFLRVGGFVLSHAGMMLVVMTLMDMCSAAAQPFVLVLGNAFVMVMEGMIVAIQIIRLEFYEVFSRFYEGDGKPFEPVGVSFSTQID